MKFKSTFFKQTFLFILLMVGVSMTAVGQATYEKVTVAPADWSGTYIISTGTLVLTGRTGTNGYCDYVSHASLSADYEVEIAKIGTTNYYSIYHKKGGFYLGGQNNTTMVFQTTAPTGTTGNFHWTLTTSGLSTATSAARSLCYNSSSPRFSMYTAGSSYPSTFLYKKVAEVPSTPTLTAIAAVAFGNQNVNTSSTQNINIKGTNLTGDLTVTVAGAGFTGTTAVTKADAEAGKDVAITFLPTVVGAATGTATISGGGLTSDVVVNLSGECTLPAMGTPTITTATQVVNDGFTANWTAAANADSYELDLYTYQGGTGVTTVMNQDFNNLVTASNTVVDFSKEVGLVGWTGNSYVYNGFTGSSHESNKIEAGSLRVSTSSNNGVFSFPCALSSDATLSFDLKNWTNMTGTAGDPGASLKISHAADGSSFVTLATIDLTTIDPIAFVAQQITVTGGTASSVFKFEATKRMFIDNIAITAGSAGTKTSVSGYPMNVGDVTSYSVGSLSPQTTYYYTVAAIRGQEKNISAEATVTTDVPNSISSTESISTIYTSNGAIHLSAVAGEMIEVYNQMGQRLYSGVAVDGINQLAISARGVLVVKAGTKVAKVVL